MRLEDEISSHFEKNEWTWTTTGGVQVPSPTDILRALDRAARELYDEPVGAQLEVGRLIITKKHRGYDVYVFFGPFE